MNFNWMLSAGVILAFSIIHFVEISSFLARLTGVKLGANALAYAVQNAVYMLTRFFSMLLLPILGLIIDFQVEKKYYLNIVTLAIASAATMSVLALVFRVRIVNGFTFVIADVQKGRSLLGSLIMLPVRVLSPVPKKIQNLPIEINLRSKTFWLSAIVFSVYATSLFLAFFLGLIFPTYRAAISQLSAVFNAFATVLLTFFVEPKISVSIDSGGYAVEEILFLLSGRIFGVGVIALSGILILRSFF